MGILDRLFRRRAQPVESVAEATPECLHTSCAPQWETAADMGNEARASRFVCSVCGRSFTPEQFGEMRRTEVERIRAALDP